MQRAQQLEEEVKLDAGPGWSLPDLEGTLPGLQVRHLPPLQLVTTYYDTTDLRLTRHRVTLRHRLEAAQPSEVAVGLAGREATGSYQGSGGGASAPSGTAAPVAGGPALPEGAWALKMGRLHAVVSTPTVSPAPGQDGGYAPPEAAWPPGTRSVWTVKLPAQGEGTLLARTEVNWPDELATKGTPGGASVPAGTSDPPPHPEAVKFLTALTLGAPLVPIARLSATRQRTELVLGGRPAAEVDEDSVEGRVVGSQASTVVFKEIEVELKAGGSRSLLEAVLARLLASGARRSGRASKLWTVLQSASPSSLPVREASSLSTGKEPPVARGPSTVAELLAEQARRCLEVLEEQDPPIRLGAADLEHVHRARVATRRFRSLLWVLRRLPAPGGQDDAKGPSPLLAGDPFLASLRRELHWLGEALGAARDADVLLATLEADCTGLDPLDQAAAERVLEQARSEKALAHQRLLEAMGDDRYLSLLRRLDALARGPGRSRPGEAAAAPYDEGPAEVWERLQVPAGAAMARLGAAQWRSMRRAVRRLGTSPSDEALHRVRIQAKRLRYVAEAAAPVLRPSSRRKSALATASAATALQDVLGELHDAVVAEGWLRDLASRAATEPLDGTGPGASNVALVIGQLVAARRAAASRSRETWGQQWRHLHRPRLVKWAAA